MTIESIFCASAADWRRWLEIRCESEKEVWLEFYRAPIRNKRDEAIKGPSYDEALDEALCFGWIDVSVKKIDEERYAQRFVPRKDPRKWTPGNVARLKVLVASKRVSPYGLSKIDPVLLE